MDTPSACLTNIEYMACESGGWLGCRVPHSEIESDPVQLLANSAQPQVGNRRFALVGGQVILIGELRDADGLLSLPEAHRRLFTVAGTDAGDRAGGVSGGVSPLDVACILAETGYEWSEAAEEGSDPVGQPQWQAIASDSSGRRCELSGSVLPGGVEIRGRLADWEADLTESSRAAITRFFVAAHARVRFVRFTLQGHEACAVSFAAADRLDVELADSVAAVVAAVRIVWHEVRALANQAVAQAYLQAAERNSL